MEVIEPVLVLVIRSCKFPISVANVGWYPTADGILPNNADTSAPARLKRKILLPASGKNMEIIRSSGRMLNSYFPLPWEPGLFMWLMAPDLYEPLI